MSKQGASVLAAYAIDRYRARQKTGGPGKGKTPSPWGKKKMAYRRRKMKKRNSRFGKVRTLHHGGSESKFVVYTKRTVPKHVRTKPFNIRQAQQTERINSVYGLQGYGDFNLNNKTYLDLSWQDIYADQTSDTGAEQRMFQDYTAGKLYLTNRSNEECIITLYDLKVKRGTNSSINTNIGSGATAEGQTGAFALAGMAPTNVKTFNTFYKICQQRTIHLQPGHTHIHNVFIKMNKMLNKETYLQTATYDPLNNCYSAFFTVHGVPVNDSSDKTHIALGSSEIDCVWDWRTKVRPIETWKNKTHMASIVTGISTEQVEADFVTTAGSFAGV